MISLFNAVIIVLYLVFAPMYYGVKAIGQLLCKIALYGVFMPFMLALCLIAYCGLGVVGWVMDFFGVDSE